MFKGLFGGRSQRHYARGIEQFNEGLLIEAIACFEEAIEAEADGPDAALARFYRAEAHARLGADRLDERDFHGALEHFDAALAEHSRFPDLHIQRAIALLHSGDPLAAEHASRAALELNPEFVDAGAVLVVAVLAQGDAGRAEDLAKQWAKIAAAKGDPLTADFLDAAGLFDAVVSCRARRQERKRIVEHAESCLRDGFWSDAAQSLEPLVEETPAYPDLRLRLAAARLGLGDLAGAGEQLQAALDRNPGFADAHVLSGIVFLRLEEVRRARGHFEAAEASGRVPLVAIYGRMLCNLRCGEFSLALTRMNQLVGEGAPPEETQVLHAILEVLVGRAATAAERFEAALTEVRHTDPLLDIVVWATDRALPDLAHGALERIEEEHRNRAEVVRAHARLRRSEGALDRARQLCESALLDHPRDCGLLLDLAGMLAQAGEAEAGLRCLDSLPDRGIGVPGAHRIRATLLRMSNRFDEARAALGSVDREPDGADALEVLYLCRTTDDADRARTIWSQRDVTGAMDLAWRVQDPERWLGPLRPWPAAVGRIRRAV